jgi:hypothetical protein
MNRTAKNKPIRPWLLRVLLLLLIVGMLAAMSIPNSVGGGPSKISSVINMLRQIDGAKEQWAFEHGWTNTAGLSHEIPHIASLLKRDKDRFDRFGFGFDKNGTPHGVQGVVFLINPLGISPEAKFTKDFKLNDRDWFNVPQIPKDTILRFGTNGAEYVLPGQKSKPYKSLSEVLAR